MSPKIMHVGLAKRMIHDYDIDGLFNIHMDHLNKLILKELVISLPKLDLEKISFVIIDKKENK